MIARLVLLLCLLAAPAFAAQAPIAGQFRKASGPAPVYPSQALKEGIAGVVDLKVTTDAQSRVVYVIVSDEMPAGNEFGQRAMEAVRYWTFEPAAAGKTFAYRITFKLK